MQESDLALTAHLMRRAGFGATRDELEVLSVRSYDAVVEDLIHPERFPDIDEDIAQRYFGIRFGSKNQWVYRMVNTRRPLEEKIALFWHHVFATANTKASQVPDQIDMFRRNGLSNVKTILTDLSRDPAMVFWLDNNENVKGQPNENYGRELLELFSMGVGNYSEDDIKNAALAFTGWTITQPIPEYPTNQGRSSFVYREDQHDSGSKTFLGHTGNFNGEQIIDIVVRQEATAKFIARHLYNFFVADEAQVPAWQLEPPRDQEAIDALVETYMDTGGEIRAMMGVLFNSDFFKEARFKRVKSPARAGRRGGQAGGNAPIPRPWHRRLLSGHHGDGTGVDEPAHGGGLAHRPGVDRRRRHDRADQLRRKRGRRPRQAGCRGDN